MWRLGKQYPFGDLPSGATNGREAMREHDEEPDVSGSGALNRRSFLARSLASGAALSLPAWAPDVAVSASCVPGPAFRNSLSVSPFTESVLKSVALSDGRGTASTVLEVQELFNRHGASEIYQRIATRKFVPQTDAEAGWARGLERAVLARELGMPFNPELGLFAGYGDGATYQEPPDFTDYPSIRLPGRWTSLTLDQMIGPLREYGALVARQILDTGVRVNFWDLGNEVENGIAGVAVRPLFPTTSYEAPNAVDPAIGLMSVPTLVAMPEDQRIAWCEAHLWPYVGRLLGAAAEGIRSVDPHARFSTHISHFGHRTPNVQVAFWQAVKAVGYLPDQLGTSYYPTAGKTTFGAPDMFEFFKQTATALGERFDRQLFIAEYGYPSSLMQPPYPFNDPVPGYPQTEAGQHDFTRDLVAWGTASGHLAGIRPWAPDFCTSEWQPMSWFTPAANTTSAKPALHAITDALTSAKCEARTRLVARFYGRRHRRPGVLARLQTTAGALTRLTVELRRGHRLIAKTSVARVGKTPHDVILKPHAGHLRAGHYTLLVTHAGKTLIRRTVSVR